MRSTRSSCNQSWSRQSWTRCLLRSRSSTVSDMSGSSSWGIWGRRRWACRLWRQFCCSIYRIEIKHKFIWHCYLLINLKLTSWNPCEEEPSGECQSHHISPQHRRGRARTRRKNGLFRTTLRWTWKENVWILTWKKNFFFQSRKLIWNTFSSEKSGIIGTSPHCPQPKLEQSIEPIKAVRKIECKMFMV
jgi:hypothetical protein